MKNILTGGKLFCMLVGVLALALCAGTGRTITPAVAQEEDQGAQSNDQSRRIWVEEFLPARGKAAGHPREKYVRKPVTPIPAPAAQKTGGRKPIHQLLKGKKPLVMIAKTEQPTGQAGKRPSNPQGNIRGRSVGITFWRLRSAQREDTSRRIKQRLSGGADQEWVPERIEAETPLIKDDKVRVSIESPDAGYLYVINSEYYADGSVGEPFMIFPTTQIRGGDNRIEAGRIIDIPAQSDPQPWFDVEAGGQAAELLTIIISETRLGGINIGSDELKLDWKLVLGWNDSWGASVERIEQAGGAGRAWTNAEQEIGSDVSRRITQANPLPQTIYHVSTKPGDPLMLTVPLKFRDFAAAR
jgi:hypothetical protein